MRWNGPLMKLSHVNKICHAMIGGSRISLEGSVDEEVYRRHFHHVTVDNPCTLCAFSDINTLITIWNIRGWKKTWKINLRFTK